jgi:hypothetical protein
MKLIKVKYIGGSTYSLLKFVKIVKDHTGMGLKDAKDFVDSVIGSPGVEIPLSVINPLEFEKDLIQSNQNAFVVINAQKMRHDKLIQLGLGSKEDLIQSLSEEISTELYLRIKRSVNESKNDGLKITSTRHLIEEITNYTTDLLLLIDENKLQELFKDKKNGQRLDTL